MTGTESQVFTALRNFLLLMFPDLTDVVQGLDNWVPAPLEHKTVISEPEVEGDPPVVTYYADSACMTAINAPRLGMGVVTYSPDSEAPETGTADHAQPSSLIIQVDFFGDGSRDKAQALQAVWAKSWCCRQFPIGIKPLACKSPVPLDFHSEGKEVIRRCEIDLEIQYIPTVSVPQDFAVELALPTSKPE